jgi:hypothetical protein
MNFVSVWHGGLLHRFAVEVFLKPFLIGAHFYLPGQEGTVPAFAAVVCAPESPSFTKLASLSEAEIEALCVARFSAPENFAHVLSGVPGKISVVLSLELHDAH